MIHGPPDGDSHVSESLKTTELHDLVDRIQAGDRQAADVLVRRSAERLENLARKMLRDFPAVRRWEQTGDVLQNSLTRLLRTLGDVTPESVAGFFRLAAQAVRRELLDMARHYAGPWNPAAHHESLPDGSNQQSLWSTGAAEICNLERWAAFHEAVERLPEREREVMELGYYEGLAKEEIGRLLGMEERTVRRWWNRATRRLVEDLGDEIPT
jgi:RNA polymerase sigma factor (sigma-70 family)